MAAFVPYGKKSTTPQDSGLSSGFGFWQSERTNESSSLLGNGNFASRATASMMSAAGGATQMGGDTFYAMKSLMEDPISMNQVFFSFFVRNSIFKIVCTRYLQKLKNHDTLIILNHFLFEK